MNKIDGVAAAIMAPDRAIRVPKEHDLKSLTDFLTGILTGDDNCVSNEAGTLPPLMYNKTLELNYDLR